MESCYVGRQITKWKVIVMTNHITTNALWKNVLTHSTNLGSAIYSLQIHTHISSGMFMGISPLQNTKDFFQKKFNVRVDPQAARSLPKICFV
jgi:hypothetical protein